MRATHRLGAKLLVVVCECGDGYMVFVAGGCELEWLLVEALAKWEPINVSL
jgi:hypothetical protein